MGEIIKKPMIEITFLRKGELPHIVEEEYHQLMNATRDPDKRMFLKIAWTLGLRLSEVLNIKTNDLIRRPDGYYLIVRRLKRRKKYIDEIPIPNELAYSIEDYIKLKGLKEGEKLFTCTRQNIFVWIQRLGRRVLKREIHPHMIRHGRVYDLVKKGVHPLIIARIVGHVDLKTTMIYYHPTPADIRESVIR